MQRVNGIGGFFFRSSDSKALAQWYETHLGVLKTPMSYDEPCWQQKAGETVFAPFGPPNHNSRYLGQAGWGINFRVDDLDAMVEQLRSSGIEVDVDTTPDPNGRFAQLSDPEGNAIQLWQPA